MTSGEFSPLKNDPGASNLDDKPQNQGSEQESLVAVIFQSTNLRKKDKEGRPVRLTWITTVLEKGQDPVEALLKEGRKVNRDQEPQPQTHQQQE